MNLGLEKHRINLRTSITQPRLLRTEVTRCAIAAKEWTDTPFHLGLHLIRCYHTVACSPLLLDLILPAFVPLNESVLTSDLDQRCQQF
jgi:hypothetical protein